MNAARLFHTGALVRMPRRWNLFGPLLPIAFAMGMIVGSWLALVVREWGGMIWH